MISPRQVAEMGVLGMNRRNCRYVLAQNPRKLYPAVDDKLRTKELLEANGLPCPVLYFPIHYNFELSSLRKIEHWKDFVIKPARGAEGRGILVIEDKVGDKWKKPNGALLSTEDLIYHVSNILAGLYSLGGVDDKAFVEYRVLSHVAFRKVAYQGVPDIRVVLYRGTAVMSMLRLPTSESDGKANLHQGAVGAGVDMASGITLGGVHHDSWIEAHPDTGAPIAGLSIPFWDEILKTAVRAYDVFKLGYLGIDFVVDQLLGPLILELNARPGLNIQLANRKGLIPRLDAVDRHRSVEKWHWEDRLKLSREIASL